MKLLLVLLVAVGVTVPATLAAASTAGDLGASDAGMNEQDTLYAGVMRDATALDLGDCALACKALASIKRAADRLCAIEPGPRCLQAQAKADDATNRVHAACPQCATVGVAVPEQKGGVQPNATAPPAPDHQVEAAQQRGGGCAGCSTSANAGLDGDAILLGALGLVAFVRRRRRGRRS